MRRELAIDLEIAAIADRQGGIVARHQLRALGLSARAVDRRVSAGRLHIRHRAVYAVGHRVIGVDGRRWAAVLTCGPGALVSHASAADAHGMRRTASAIVDVTVGLNGRARRPGIRLHRRLAPAADEVTHLAGLPITTPARTLLDLAAIGVRGRALEEVLDLAEHERLIDFADLHVLLARYPGRPGTGSLREQLDRYEGPADTRSKLERLVYQLCDDHGLPQPLVNCVIEGKVRDFYWPHRRLVVEADSYRWHRSPSALNDDRERDVELALAGYTTLRFTWEQVAERPEYVIAAIRAALGE